ncbi:MULTISPECIES: sensor histidine kinase [Duganella]|uniref:sensor histidine kinase n=1 Tax=Duganella TaxID=75654 RepID=UPI0030EA4053
MRPLNSLKWRLGLWVFLPSVIISAIDLIVTYRSTDRIATLVQEQLLKGSARIIAEQLVSVDGGYEISIPPAALELFASKYHDMVFYSVRSKSGQLIAGDAKLTPYPGALAIEQEDFFITTMRGEPARTIAYAQALPNMPAGEFAVTQVAQTLRGHEAFRRDLFLLTMRQHLLILAIVILGLIITLRWTLKPLARFGEKLQRRSPGSLETLDASSEAIELQPLADAINDYVGRLDYALSSYERFVANTAHQLRTSFAIISSQLNFAQRSPGLHGTQKEVLTAIQKSVQQGTRVINQLLVLASLERKRQQQEDAPHIQLSVVLIEALDALAPLAQQRQIDLGVDCVDETIMVVAPPHLLRELVSNLVDNAIQHTPRGSTVTVALSRRADQGWLRVVDNGPGIPADERDKVFERFYRLDVARPNSSGLGLAIVKEICVVLGAQISLSVPAEGIGLQVDVVLPLLVESSRDL